MLLTKTMKKFFILLCLTAILYSCGGSTKPQAPVEKWIDGLVTEYPNYDSNELTKKAVRDSVVAFGNKAVDKPTDFLNGVEFRFAKMVENGDSVAVFFDSSGCRSEIDAPENSSRKYVYTDIIIRVLGKVDKATAAKLDKEKLYTLTGVVHAWDEEDRFFISTHAISNIDLGTFILNDDIEITEVPAK